LFRGARRHDHRHSRARPVGGGHLLPNGGSGPTPARVLQYRSTMLKYAGCMRAHAVSNMPDPDSRGHLNIGPGTDVDVNSPRFQTAFQVCKSKLSP
jgi:hypothetical protein